MGLLIRLHIPVKIDRLNRLIFANKFSKSAKAQKLLSERGPKEIIKDFEVEILKTIQ